MFGSPSTQVLWWLLSLLQNTTPEGTFRYSCPKSFTNHRKVCCVKHLVQLPALQGHRTMGQIPSSLLKSNILLGEIVAESHLTLQIFCLAFFSFNITWNQRLYYSLSSLPTRSSHARQQAYGKINFKRNQVSFLIPNILPSHLDLPRDRQMLFLTVRLLLNDRLAIFTEKEREKIMGREQACLEEFGIVSQDLIWTNSS